MVMVQWCIEIETPLWSIFSLSIYLWRCLAFHVCPVTSDVLSPRTFIQFSREAIIIIIIIVNYISRDMQCGSVTIWRRLLDIDITAPRTRVQNDWLDFFHWRSVYNAMIIETRCEREAGRLMRNDNKWAHWLTDLGDERRSSHTHSGNLLTITERTSASPGHCV